jgi:hypothetical protein
MIVISPAIYRIILSEKLTFNRFLLDQSWCPTFTAGSASPSFGPGRLSPILSSETGCGPVGVGSHPLEMVLRRRGLVSAIFWARAKHWQRRPKRWRQLSPSLDKTVLIRDFDQTMCATTFPGLVKKSWRYGRCFCRLLSQIVAPAGAEAFRECVATRNQRRPAT